MTMTWTDLLAVPRRSSVVRPTCWPASWTRWRRCSTSAPPHASTLWPGTMRRSSASSPANRSPSAPWTPPGCPTTQRPHPCQGSPPHPGARDHRDQHQGGQEGRPHRAQEVQEVCMHCLTCEPWRTLSVNLLLYLVCFTDKRNTTSKRFVLYHPDMKMNADVSLMINWSTSCPHHAMKADVLCQSELWPYYLFALFPWADQRGKNLENHPTSLGSILAMRGRGWSVEVKTFR